MLYASVNEPFCVNDFLLLPIYGRHGQPFSLVILLPGDNNMSQPHPFSPDQPDPPSNATNLHDFSFDDFLAEEEIVDDVVDEATKILKHSIEALQEVPYDSQSGPRKYIIVLVF